MFVTLFVVIFACDVVYMAKLYKSIRNNVERDVMAALVDTDIDDMWERAERRRKVYMAVIAQAKESGDTTVVNPESTTISSSMDGTGGLTTTAVSNTGTTDVHMSSLETDRSYSNQLTGEMSRQMHSQMDERYEFNLAITDSIFVERLADRHIYPEFVAVEIVDSLGNVLNGNIHVSKDDGSYDTFTLCFNPYAGRYYKAYLTPLTGHILSQMSGIIVATLLLMIVFAAAFCYLYRTVSKLRTIEEMKDDFVNNVTHELKTPIAIAYSANDALLHYDADRYFEKRETYLKIANRQLTRLGELVENILAMSMERRKSMQLNPETISLRPFLEDIAAMHHMRGDKDVEINVVGPIDAKVDADRSHLANVMNNLIDNAIKYSGDNVKITLKYANSMISVADNGIGIPAKSLPYIFNKFYRVPHGDRQDVRGYGIGLYYVKSIIDKIGWSVNVKSTEGVGSVFTIKFGKDD